MRALDLTGKTFGSLTPVRVEVQGSKRGWVCQCSCGDTKWFPTFQLTAGNAVTCGGDVHRQGVNVGDVFGDLTVTKAGLQKSDGRWAAVCSCTCGSSKEVAVRYLQRGTTHCGCKTDHSNRGLPSGLSAMRGLISVYKGNAKTRSLPFELSEEQCQLLFESDCFFCGDAPSAVFTKKNLKGSFTYNGIDRVDSSKGYVIGNVNACCADCNYLKSNRTNEDFIARVKKIANKH